jgi:hypothetical protein
MVVVMVDQIAQEGMVVQVVEEVEIRHRVQIPEVLVTRLPQRLLKVITAKHHLL